MRKRRTAPREAEPLLHRFDRDPLDAAACLDRLYAAFAAYRPRWNWCRRCFTEEYEAQVRAAGNPRRAPLERFAHIYGEHPDCSGGRETFLHWLPRGLELTLLDLAHDFVPMEGAERLGLWRWPREEQDALRVLFCRVALNWFDGGAPDPLKLPTPIASRKQETRVSARIVDALLTLRVEPFDLLAWLARRGGARARDVLVDLVGSDSLVDAPFYYVLEDPADEPVQQAGAQALDRLARDALHRIASEARLLRLWAWAETADPALARAIEAAEAERDACRVRLAPAARRADRALVAAAVGERP